MSYVRITNGTAETVLGRYDGEDYEFPSGASVDVEESVATHVFGFRQPDKSSCLARLGWLTMSDQRKAAMEKLSLVRFEAIELVGRPIVDHDDGATSQEIAPSRIGTASPRVSSDGDSGGSFTAPPGEPLADADTI